MVVLMVRNSLGQNANQQCQSVRLIHIKKLLHSLRSEKRLNWKAAPPGQVQRAGRRQREAYKHLYHSKQTYPNIGLWLNAPGASLMVKCIGFLPLAMC